MLLGGSVCVSGRGRPCDSCRPRGSGTSSARCSDSSSGSDVVGH